MQKVDLGMTDNGDFMTISNNGLKDFSLVSDEQAIKQSVDFRLKTNIRELFLHQEIGNELIEIIGKRNTRETAQQGINYIVKAISLNNYIPREQITVEAVPIETNKIVFIVNIDYREIKAFRIVLEVDLQDGIRRVS